ncbi:hypothetical protein ADL27_05410 [Streptomyces sp. NRRL F-6602]|nr:hypothetical protein ADL27_05410 [Streptomyces sp. NRRL F-6602]
MAGRRGRSRSPSPRRLRRPRPPPMAPPPPRHPEEALSAVRATRAGDRGRLVAAGRSAPTRWR